MSHVNLGNVLYDNGEFAAAREPYEIALSFDRSYREAHQGLAYVLAELGDEAGSRCHRRKAFQDHAVTVLPFRELARWCLCCC